MRATTKALEHYRTSEKEYLIELVSIRSEIEFLLDFMEKSSSHRIQAPMVEDLEEKATLIQKALQELELLPVPYELRVAVYKTADF